MTRIMWGITVKSKLIGTAIVKKFIATPVFDTNQLYY